MVQPQPVPLTGVASAHLHNVTSHRPSPRRPGHASPLAALTSGPLHLQFPLPGSFFLGLPGWVFLNMRSQGSGHLPSYHLSLRYSREAECRHRCNLKIF